MANCTQSIGPLDAENDIVGPGALAAFFTTAAITYLAVILAYVTDTLDKRLINPFDVKVVEMTRKALFRFKHKTKDPEPGTETTLPSKSDQKPSSGKKARKDAISNFLISLSDQQLVTGLAVLVAAVSGHQTLTGYDYSVATCLGWFSCTTHLTTIDVLCVHFNRHGFIRHIRVAGLICLMVLLSYAFIRTTSTSSFTIPVDCPENAPWVDYTDILCLLPLWIDYFTAVRKIYLGPPTSVWDVSELAGHKSSRNDNSEVSAVRQLSATKTQRHTEEVERLITTTSKEHAQKRLGFLFYDGSFLETFPDMTYSFCFGIAEIVVLRSDAPELSEESTEMGFGQITAVLLLLLPFLAIGEAYTSYSSEKKSLTEGNRPEEPQKGVGEDHDKGAQGYSETAVKGNNAEIPARGPSEQASEAAAESLQRATQPDDHISVQHIHSNIPDTSPGNTNYEDTSDTVEHGESLKNVEDLDQYFPVELEKLSRPNQSRDLATSRQALLHRYILVKTAESKMGLRWPMALFGLHLSIGVIASVFLNSYDYHLQLAGTILNVISVILGNLKTVHRVLRFFQ